MATDKRTFPLRQKVLLVKYILAGHSVLHSVALEYCSFVLLLFFGVCGTRILLLR